LTLQRFINIIVHNLGLVIDRSDQRLIYKDYLYPVDSFTIDLNERATPTAFGEPRSYETLTAVGEWARSE
jgi:hypothetical protein